MTNQGITVCIVILAFTAILAHSAPRHQNAGKNKVGNRGSVEHRHTQDKAYTPHKEAYIQKPPTGPVHQRKPYYTPNPGQFSERELELAINKYREEKNAKLQQDQSEVLQRKKLYDPAPWRTCIFTNWAQYMVPPYKFNTSDIDPLQCTHIIYAFSSMDEADHSLIPFEQNDHEMYSEINAMKNFYPHLRTILAVGGWTFGTARMTRMMSSKDNRTMFIDSVIETLNVHGFDGIDIDFEYPAQRGSPEIDRAQFTCLCQELRDAFDAENPTRPLSLSVGIAGYNPKIDIGYNILGVAAVVDKINLMSYDYWGINDDVVNHHSPLYRRADLAGTEHEEKNIDDTVQYLISVGCPRHKLNIGLALYGRGWTLSDESQTAPMSPAMGPSLAGGITGALGTKAYFEICSDLNRPDVELKGIADERVRYLHYRHQWIGFEDRASLEAKIDYIVEQNLGGYMAWALDDDDFKGTSCQEGTYPLMRAINSRLDSYFYVVPEDTTFPPPFPIPPADETYCEGVTDGVYVDLYTCGRRYTCAEGSTTVDECGTDNVYDPADPTECLPVSQFDSDELCLTCPEFCDCDSMITPLGENDDRTEEVHQGGRCETC